MGVFTFVCRNSGDEWTGKSLSGDLEASARSTFDLQRKLIHTALSFDSSNGVQSSFSFVTPTSAIFQVIVGAPAAAAFVGGGAAASAPSGGAASAAEEKKEEKKEESEDEDMGFSLFD